MRWILNFLHIFFFFVIYSSLFRCYIKSSFLICIFHHHLLWKWLIWAKACIPTWYYQQRFIYLHVLAMLNSINPRWRSFIFSLYRFYLQNEKFPFQMEICARWNWWHGLKNRKIQLFHSVSVFPGAKQWEYINNMLNDGEQHDTDEETIWTI